MLDTQTLCARVTAPARAKPRSLYVTASSKRWADELRERGYADKTTTRVLTDGVLALVDPHDDVVADSFVLTLFQENHERLDAEDVVKAQLSLREETWESIDAYASAAGVSPSQFVRVICHVAVERVYNELTGR